MRTVVLALGLGLWLLACRDPAGPPRCVRGASAACGCPDGRRGAQVCQSDGTFAPCRCEPPPNAPGDEFASAVAAERARVEREMIRMRAEAGVTR